jgi:hypothetical protein
MVYRNHQYSTNKKKGINPLYKIQVLPFDEALNQLSQIIENYKTIHNIYSKNKQKGINDEAIENELIKLRRDISKYTGEPTVESAIKMLNEHMK